MHLRPEYFIVRPSSTGRQETIVPLIAVDQLPDWIQLAGAPRELNAEQAVGLKSLGVARRGSDGVYVVRLRSDKIRDILDGALDEEETASPSPLATERGQSADSAENCVSAGHDGARGKGKARRNSPAGRPPTGTVEPREDDSSGRSAVDPGEKPAKAQRQKHKNKPTGKEGRASPRAASPMLKASRYNVPNTGAGGPSTAAAQARKDKTASLRPHTTEERRATDKERVLGGTAPPHHRRHHPETVYCRHWCHHGSCKWGVQCRYQHRMPATLEGLREVGLREFPTWYLLFMRFASSGEATTGYHSGAGAELRPGLGGSSNAHMGGTNSGSSSSSSSSNNNHNHNNNNSSSNNSNNSNSNSNKNLFHNRGATRLPHHPADVLLGLPGRTQLPSHHPSPVDLGLVQDRISALLASSTATSNRRQLRQFKEMRELLLHAIPAATTFSTSNDNDNDNDNTRAPHPTGGADRAPRPASPLGGVGGGYRCSPHQGRADLHTKASLAASAERAMDAAVMAPPAARRRRGDSVCGLEDLAGRLSPVISENEETDEGASRMREGNLVDLD